MGIEDAVATTTNSADLAIRMARRLPTKYYELLEAYLGLDGREERSILELARARKVTRAKVLDDIDRAAWLLASAQGRAGPSFDNHEVFDLLIVGAMREKGESLPF